MIRKIKTIDFIFCKALRLTSLLNLLDKELIELSQKCFESSKILYREIYNSLKFLEN